MIGDLETHRAQSEQAQEAAIHALEAGLAKCEKQIDLLLDMRLSEAVGEAEYVSKKHTLINRKAELRGKLESFAQNSKNRFEPVTRFVLEAKHASILLAEGKPEEKRDFLKKIGSNLQVAEKTLAVTFRNPWQLVADFNSGSPSPIAREGENPENLNWRRGRDSNPSAASKLSC